MRNILMSTGVLVLGLAGLYGPAHAETTFATTASHQIRVQWTNATSGEILKAMAEKANKKLDATEAVQQQKLAAGAIEAASFDDLLAGVLEHAEYEIVGEGPNEIISVSALNDFPLATDKPVADKPTAAAPAPAPVAAKGISEAPTIPVMPQVPSDANSDKTAQSLDELQRQRAQQQNGVFYYYATGDRRGLK